MLPYYQVGITVATTSEHPEGMPCILVGGDSVLCQFPGQPFAMEQAQAVCELLNSAQAVKASNNEGPAHLL